MLVLARYVALISTLRLLISGASGVELADKKWWESTLVYQIWPRGFQDSDGDGEGDLKGIIDRLDYIEYLGVETIWLSPIFTSPLIDSGYDVSDYLDIHPLFGNMEDFDNLVEEAHDRGLKIILDIVPNHSSDQHGWFQLSSLNIEHYTDYYIWANGSVDRNGNNIPPNNWLSIYSDEEGSAWTWHDGRQQWYYHKFHYSQPDLNLRNERVIEELLEVFEFWLGRNVDGFRINAVPYFFEDKDLRSEPFLRNDTYTFGLPESTALLYTFRDYIDNWVSRHNATSKLLISESYDSDDNLMEYYGNGTHEGIPPFNFKFITHIQNSSDADYIKSTLGKWLGLLPESSSTNWVLSNHDNPRAATRIGLNRVDGLHMLSLLLPGQAYTYYGDEIAMLDATVPWHRTIDPVGCARGRSGYVRFSRDPARTPMQWSAGTSAGFSRNETTYLPVHPNYVHRNVKAQRSEERSNLKTYRELAILRKELVFTDGGYEFATLNNNHVLVLKRFLNDHPVYVIAVNLGIRREEVNLTAVYPNLDDTLEVVVTSSNAIRVTETVPRDNVTLTANAAYVLRGRERGRATDEPTSATTANSTDGKTTPSSGATDGGGTTTTTGRTSTNSNNTAPYLLAPAARLVISAALTVVASYRV